MNVWRVELRHRSRMNLMPCICTWSRGHDGLQCVHGQRPLVGCMHESKHREARIMGHAGVMHGVLKSTVKVWVQEVYRQSLSRVFNQPSPRDEDVDGPPPAPDAALSV